MNFSQIGQNTLKISLSASELAYRGLSFQALRREDCATRRLVAELLNEARLYTGFCTERELYALRLYGRHSGGCTLFAERRERAKRPQASSVYSFEANAFLQAQRRLPDLFARRTSVYMMEGRCFVVLPEKVPEALCEYGRREEGKYIGRYLLEHGERCRKKARGETDVRGTQKRM